jgi:hypothetical protein
MPLRTDTARAAEQLQDAVILRMTGAERLLLACEMSDLARELAWARLRRDHPDWATERIVAAFLRQTIPPSALPPQLL